MRLILAPMQGVVDHSMREMLTRIGGYDRCVTEFIRVTHSLLPEKVFFRYCPELKQDGKTLAGTPVTIQFLGGSPGWLADNAVKAAQLGARGIDLNFGCPAKVVNRHDGGSVLLKEPSRVADIVRAVRDAVDPAVPVTAKIRLGFKDASLLADIAGGIEEAGASELCIHARTRDDGYKPPAYWQHIKPVQQQLTIPVIVNGEIWTPQDALQATLSRNSQLCPSIIRDLAATAVLFLGVGFIADGAAGWSGSVGNTSSTGSCRSMLGAWGICGVVSLGAAFSEACASPQAKPRLRHNSRRLITHL